VQDGQDTAVLGRVVSVNVGVPRTVRWHGREVTTAIWKEPVSGRRPVAGVNVAGDDQADRRVHGGPTKSLYVYGAADYDWWAEQLGTGLGPGTFGDNLTVEGFGPSAAVIGERWEVGTTVVRVTEPRIPCFKLGIRMGDASFVDRFAEAARPGTYLAIERDGEIGAGDEIRLLHRPGHGLSVGDVERAHHGSDDRLAELIACEDLSVAWRGSLGRRLERLAR
jgi:MOSC domain-containing protein YiiM